MTENIFMGGHPVVGFGSDSREESEKKFYGAAVGLPLVGIVGGAYIGHHMGGGAKTVVGGLSGGLAGVALFTVGWWALAATNPRTQ